ncbi:MAG: UPF0223 family protein [Bacilli bacterium]
MKEYKIDYDMFTTEEIVKIYAFFSLIESTAKRGVPAQMIIDKHKEYQKIINNKSLEKQYDKMLYEQTKISIYEIVKQAKGKLTHASR